MEQEYTVKDYLQNLAQKDNEFLHNRYLKKVSNKSINITAKELFIDLAEILYTENEAHDDLLYDDFSSIVDYPCYSTLKKKLLSVAKAAAKIGYKLNLVSICEDINNLFKAVDFAEPFSKLGGAKTEEEQKALIDMLDSLFINIVTQRALNNESIETVENTLTD